MYILLEKELIQQYKDDFFLKTGLNLKCEVTLPLKSISQILKCTIDYFNTSIGELTEKVRYNNIIKLRQFVVGECDFHEIETTNIALKLDCDRTTVLNTRRRFEHNYKYKEGYKEEFDKFHNYVNNLNNGRKNMDKFP